MKEGTTLENAGLKTLKPHVMRYHEGIHLRTKAKGFSRAELSEVNLTLNDARRQGIRTDVRRRSKNVENVALLNEYKKTLTKVPKSPRKKRSKKVSPPS